MVFLLLENMCKLSDSDPDVSMIESVCSMLCQIFKIINLGIFLATIVS